MKNLTIYWGVLTIIGQLKYECFLQILKFQPLKDQLTHNLGQ